MAIRMQCICVDSSDPQRIATFWAQALGWRRTLDSAGEVVLEPPAGSLEDGVVPDLVFLRVPESKAVKNRLHVDLRPDDQEAEIARLLELGATHADVGQTGNESFTVLADPEGNEFCVLRELTAAELASQGLRYDGPSQG